MVDRQISLGQFVATEIIIVLLTSSVEKLIQSIDNIFDALTAVEKLGYVTDMPLEREQGFRFAPADYAGGLQLEVSDLYYHYEGRSYPALNGVSFSLAPGASLCITGSNGSGKNTLIRVLSGLLTEYKGGITFNGISMRDLNVVSLRTYIEQNISVDDIFEGSILENITMGRNQISLANLEWALQLLDLTDYISKLPDGLSTTMLPGGRRFSESFIARVTLARCIVTKPKILMINDFLYSLTPRERHSLTSALTTKGTPWSLIILSNDPTVMQQCDRVLVMDAGKIAATGKYEVIKGNPVFAAHFNEIEN